MDDYINYIKLCVAALLPVIAAVVLYLLDRKTRFGSLSGKVRQIIYGVCFGILAIIGTEWGIDINDAQVNCRDAAVLTAGLMFGGPAGIIAGVIGAVERWIAVAWGVGTFTRLACTISTFAAGIYAAVLRRFMFENKNPGWFISFAVGVVMEVFHMTMVFVTNMNDPERAMNVLKAAAPVMILTNALSLMLASVVLLLISQSRREKKDGTATGEQSRITQTIQRWLLITVILAFLATSLFVFRLQDRIAVNQRDSLLIMALDEVEADIRDASDENLLNLTRLVADEVTVDDLRAVANRREIAEINLINRDGIITASTNPDFVGYDMRSGEQSADFLRLLQGTEELVQDYGPISYDENVYRKYAGVSTEYGFIQIGYDALQIQHDIDNDVIDITKNRHVGQTGFILIIDKNYGILSAPDDLPHDTLTRDLIDTGIPAEDVIFSATLAGEPCFLSNRHAESYIILSVLPEAEAMRTRSVAVTANTFMEILVFAVMFGLIYLLIKKVVVDQIMSVNQSLGRITAGDLDEVVNVRSSAEFSLLSDDINTTVDTLKQYIEEASARIDTELGFAESIQKSALPNVFPAFPKRKDFDIFALMNPANEVGGDFYDFYLTGTDTLHFLVADVSGKGIPAAMFMMRAKTELKSLTEAQLPLCDVFTAGNNALCEGNDAGMFVTAWQGSLDLQTGLLQYANAGHNPPLVRHAGGRFEYLRDKSGIVLAGLEDVKYKTQELTLSPGDVIYLYTDGVTEATNAQEVLYGEQRLLDALNSREFESMEDVCRFVREEVDAFVGDAPQFDDITMVAMRFIGTPPPPEIRFDEAAIDDITAVTEFVDGELEKMDCPMKTVIQINVAIDELYSNIVRYGYKNRKGPITVKVIRHEDADTVYIRFEDEGIPYNPLNRQDPDITLSAEEREIGGLGIFMVKKTMDDIRYKYENGHNILTIAKKIGGTKI
ncbi:MAG: SpoIIE family protein phosphatase [Clostridia bacterium]|nr:SpoIIE family protein phosphatase [Clostridia bacterium]